MSPERPGSAEDELRLSPLVAWVETAGDVEGVAAALLPEGPPLLLHDSAALVWGEAVQGGTPTQVVRRVAEATGQPVEVVEADVRDLLDLLLDRGLLTRTD